MLLLPAKVRFWKLLLRWRADQKEAFHVTAVTFKLQLSLSFNQRLYTRDLSLLATSDNSQQIPCTIKHASLEDNPVFTAVPFTVSTFPARINKAG
jgi:hypothetical protein